MVRCVGVGILAIAVLSPLAPAASVSIVLDLQTTVSAQSLAEMKREFGLILKPSGLVFDYKTRREAEQIESENLVVIRFTGQCVLKPTSQPAESGALGFAYIVDGSVQPFGEVDCERVTRAVGSVMSEADYLRSDELLGRALGRILAHEVVHMLRADAVHGRDGVAFKEFTGRMLIAPELRLQARDIAQIRVGR